MYTKKRQNKSYDAFTSDFMLTFNISHKSLLNFQWKKKYFFKTATWSEYIKTFSVSFIKQHVAKVVIANIMANHSTSFLSFFFL